MSFFTTDIQKILFDTGLSEEQKLRKILYLGELHMDDIRDEEYEYGKKVGYDEGYEEAKLEYETSVKDPKAYIQSIIDNCNNDSISLEELYNEFQIQMVLKNII